MSVSTLTNSCTPENSSRTVTFTEGQLSRVKIGLETYRTYLESREGNAPKEWTDALAEVCQALQIVQAA